MTPSTTRAAQRCLVCGRPAGDPFVELRRVPLDPNVLWPSAEAARAAPRGDIALAYCDGCGLIWNTRFDPDVLSYGPEYENSLHFSHEFQRFSAALADRLLDSYELTGKHVAEVGSGKGEFLALLCERGGCTGVGFDPSYAGEADGRADGRLTFVRDVFREDSDVGPADLVVCRHVVEHLDDPVGLLTAVRRALGEREAAVYLEVPSGEYMLHDDALWDLIYAHVTFLSAPALRTILERAGFSVHEHGYAFGEQYLWAEASNAALDSDDGSRENGAISPLVSRFAERVATKRARCAGELRRFLDRGSVALWGAGAKGTTFLNILEAGEAIDTVVDVNPRKHGKHVPGTGHLITGPPSLRKSRPRTVIVMNPVYREEIERMVRALGVRADVVVA
jgi:SAM-dependent methyltransferase